MALKAACGHCNAWLAQGGKAGVCRARPPQALLAGMKQSPGLAGIPGSARAEPMVLTVFPQMKDTGWCRDWEPSTAMEGAFMRAAKEHGNGQQAKETEAAAPA
jgi:hypothetical protein